MEMWVKRGLLATIRGFTQNQPDVSSGRVRERDITRLFCVFSKLFCF